MVKPRVENTAGGIVRAFDGDLAQLALPFAVGRPDRGGEVPAGKFAVDFSRPTRHADGRDADLDQHLAYRIVEPRNPLEIDAALDAAARDEPVVFVDLQPYGFREARREIDALPFGPACRTAVAADRAVSRWLVPGAGGPTSMP